jgi:hypothetical protein
MFILVEKNKVLSSYEIFDYKAGTKSVLQEDSSILPAGLVAVRLSKNFPVSGKIEDFLLGCS